MLRISRLTDYAIVLATRLAARDGVSATAGDLAKITGIPGPTVAKLLKALTAGGLLRSIQGCQGGYVLARPPASIGLTEIIETVEGRIALTECHRTDGDCGIMENCQVHRHWQVINRTLREALQAIRLADLLAPAPPAARAAKAWTRVCDSASA